MLRTVKFVMLLAFVFVVLGAEATNKSMMWQNLLPHPVYDEKPELVSFYEKAWALAHDRIDELPGLPAPRYMDEAHMSNRIWIWDTCFMVHFCKYCPKEFPGIESLENFYGVMLADANKPLPKVRGNVRCGADEGKMLDFREPHTTLTLLGYDFRMVRDRLFGMGKRYLTFGPSKAFHAVNGYALHAPQKLCFGGDLAEGHPKGAQAGARMARHLNHRNQRRYRLKFADTYYGELNHYGMYWLKWADVRR